MDEEQQSQILKPDFKSIKDWNEEERPREKMMQKGSDALTNVELLAILLGGGIPGKSAVDLARELYESAGNDLSKLARFDLKAFQKFKGIGPAKAITLMTALELGRRKQIDAAIEKKVIRGSRDAANLLQPILGDLPNEVFMVIYLNNSQKVLHYETISSGGLTSTVVDIRMIIRNTLQWHANKIIIAHNHPSGNLTPSQADKRITQKLKNAAELLDITLQDHIIVTANEEYYSFADNSQL